MMSAETSYSPPAPNKVLGNDDLVGEILSRVDSPTTLVRAAAVSKLWLRVASDRAFLRRFRARHPPRLLGFYVTGDWMPRPEFVPTNTEVISAASLRRAAGSVLHAFPEFSSPGVWDSRNGRVLFDHGQAPAAPDRYHAALLPDDDLVPSRGDDSVLYLFHAKGDKLSVWLRRMGDEQQLVAGEWVLRDTLSVKETCGHLVEPGPELASVVGVGDNAEFAFLEMGVGDNYFVIYLHLGSRKAEKVYQRDPDNDDIIQVHPFMTVWPPVFPSLDSDEELRLG
ncbi:hypothetical protein PR202_ga07287 [Eleusine coracana subsp. coracana]|uniref:F-box protein AT5G49610-like beta-propeller domain-containing protein n=1 Tax=Eleusine coracana subsp. coracana TaxID=191504 RepID=A0AAV5BZP1_ELECO|nr:hypothetical protein PR202_ga07287 [Eleusine coracana subsp. coracana]